MRYATVLLLLACISAPVIAQDLNPVVYVSEHKIAWDRVDSLRTLTARYDIPWRDYIASKVDGYQRWYFTHDTGDEANYFIVTQYPDWDYVRGDEIDFEALWEEYKEANAITDEDEKGVEQAFQWAYEGATHTDRILRPITAVEEDD